MANREISQFATMAAGAQSSTMYLPIVDTSLGHVAGANQKITLDSLFFDLGANTADGATGMSGLLAAPSAAAAGSLKWYYNDATKFWLASIDGGSYYSVQRSIAAGLTAGWLPYVDTGGILNGSANATLDGNGQIGCKFLNLTSNAAGLNSVAEINDSTSVDRWEIRLGASNQLIINDVQNSKDVLSLTPGATPVISLTGTLRFATDNSFDFGLVSSGRVRTIYAGTSIFIGRANNQTGQLTLYNSTNSNTTSFQAGAAAASRTYTWPTDFGVAGSILTDAAGNGTLSWATAGLSNPYVQDSGSSGAIYFQYSQNTPSVGRWGVERGSGGAQIFTGSSLNAVVFGSTTASLVEFFYNDTKQFTIPTALGSSGQFLQTNGAGVTTWATPSATIGGSIAAGQVAYGSGTNTITGSAGFTFSGTGLVINQAAYQTFNLHSTGSSADFTVTSDGANANAFLQGRYSYLFFYSGTAGVVNQKWQQYMLDADNALRFYNIVNSQTHMVLGASTSPDASYTTLNSRLVIGTTSSSGSAGQLDVTLTSSSRVGQIIKLAPAQSVDALQVQDSGGTILTKITSAGVTAGNNGFGTWINNTASPNAFFGNTGNNVAHVLAVFKGMASQSGSLSQWQNSGGTVLHDINSGGMLTIGTASTNLDRAIYIKSPGYDTSASVYGILSAYTVPTTATTSATGYYAQVSVGSASYTVASSYNFYAAAPSISGSGLITTAYGLYIAKQKQTGVTTGYGVYQADAADINYFAGILRLQTTSTVGVLSMGGASSAGAYFGVSTSSQVANDKLISVSMAGSITGLLYAADISMTATTGVLTRITNTENATNTSNCELQLVTGGASAGDPFIHFNISGNTDWSIGADNSDSDKLVIAASTALGTSNALTITTAGLVTFAGSIVITGKQKNLTVSTGAGSALLGANSPAGTLTAPFEWINVTLSDGSTGYVPAWK